MPATETVVDNGVNVAALLGAREAPSAAPEAARFNWRAVCTWLNGTHSRSSVDAFFGLGQDQRHRTEFTFEADHPEIFASADKGATPVEFVLVGLGSCLTAGIAAIASPVPSRKNIGQTSEATRASVIGKMSAQPQ